jgi:hypothetical protein
MSNREPENKARMRYRKRGIYDDANSPRKIALNDLAHRLTPSLDFYIFSIFSGLICGVGFLKNSPALLLLSVVLIPFYAPFFGIVLAITTGSVSFLMKSLFRYLLGVGLFLLSAFGVGGYARLNNALTQETVNRFTQVYPLMLVTVGVSGFLASFYAARKSDQKPQALGAGMMAGILLPLGLAGFSLGLQYTTPVVDCLKTGTVYGLVAMTAVLSGYLLSRIFVPRFLSFLLSGLVLLLGITYLLDYTHIAAFGLNERFDPFFLQVDRLLNPPTRTPSPSPTITLTPSPAPTETATLTFTATVDTATPTLTHSPTVTATVTRTLSPTVTVTNPPPTASQTPTLTSIPTKEPTPTRTIRPSRTPTMTFTPSATVIYAIVHVSNDVGLLIREAPEFGSNILKSQNNGSLLEILGDRRENSGLVWVKVRTNEGLEGWTSEMAIRTTTPMP